MSLADVECRFTRGPASARCATGSYNSRISEKAGSVQSNLFIDPFRPPNAPECVLH